MPCPFIPINPSSACSFSIDEIYKRKQTIESSINWKLTFKQHCNTIIVILVSIAESLVEAMIGNFSSFTLQSVSAILSAELNALKKHFKDGSPL